MIKIYLENNFGERISLFDDDKRFSWEPSGLGFAEDRTVLQVEYGFFIASSNKYVQPEMSGRMVFWDDVQDPYKSHQEFVDWITRAESLSFVYEPYKGRELYMDVTVDSIAIPEPILYGALECPVVFRGTSPYHKKNPLTFLFKTKESSNPMQFPFKFPFRFSDSGAGDTQVFTPTGHFPAAMELTINGPASNIYFKCEDAATGEVIGALDLTGVSVLAGDRVYYSSRPNADGVWKISGNTQTDLVELLNENVENFFTLPVGREIRAKLTADTTAGAEITHALRVHEYFKG